MTRDLWPDIVWTGFTATICVAAIVVLIWAAALGARRIWRRLRTIPPETVCERCTEGHGWCGCARDCGADGCERACPWCTSLTGLGHWPWDCTCPADCGDITCRHLPVSKEHHA
jgi:hypothetical protein